MKSRPRVEPQPLGGCAEADRTAVHETGHSLVNFILTGRAGSICLKRGEAHTRPEWPHDLPPIDETGGALFCALIDLAGISAEEVVYGNYDVPGAWGTHADGRTDLQMFERDLSHLHQLGWAHLDRFGLKLVDHYLLRRFKDALWAGLRRVKYRDYTSGDWLDDSYIAACPELASWHDRPLLSGNWLPEWDALALVATKHHLAHPGVVLPLRSEDAIINACRAHLTRR